MASTYLKKTFDGAEASTKGTFSFWVKRSKLGAEQYLYINSVYGTSSATRGEIRFDGDDKLRVRSLNSGSATNEKVTSMVFRDTNAWYHIVASLDYTNASSSNYQKIYVNGNELTDFSTNSNTSTTNQFFQGSDLNGQLIGKSNGSEYLDGCLSHYHCVVGTVYTPSTFGETDSTTGEWKIKTNVGISTANYGAAGFFILEDGNSITDQSGNGNNFTVGGGTLTKTEDNPSNIFCTWNPNYRSARKDMTLTNGNTFIFEQNSGDSAVSGTIGVSSGKWYWEQIIAQVNGTNAAVIGGLHTTEDFNESPTDALSNNTCGMRANGNVYKNGSDLGNFTTADPNGDIFGIGFDADNGSVYFWRNGTALNSGNAIITGLDMTKTWIPFGVQHGGARVTTSTNFGNGYFQTTAVSSAGTNASGIGIFEYDVPTGYTALSTKGLNL